MSKNRVRQGSEKLKKCGKLFNTFTASLDDLYIVNKNNKINYLKIFKIILNKKLYITNSPNFLKLLRALL